MSAALPLSLFVLGLASGLHCAGMCGPVVVGFAVVQKQTSALRQLAFNLGRITSYAAAGAAAGALGGAGAYAAAVLPAQTLLYLLASLFVVLAGLHLAGLLPLHHLEKAGLPLWRRVQPLAARALRGNAYAAGLLWGWLPCGLAYGALLAAVFAGGALDGALAMAAFGLGTVPWLLAAGAAAARLRGWQGLPWLRRAAGALLVGVGAWGVAHGVEQTVLCL